MNYDRVTEKTLVTTPQYYSGQSPRWDIGNKYPILLSKGFFTNQEPTVNGQRNTLFYSPPKYVILDEERTVDGKVKREYVIRGGYVAQAPVDNNVPMEYVIDLLVIDKKVITNVGFVNISVTGGSKSPVTVNPDSAGKHPVAK